ncbi:ribbon-helix-helix domain-containing protein [Paenibacillus sp. RC67]|uniref:ribbon-helix-helix domain-containing protein n=1 Tax=Paenibacillus sp. RC67 TaxID=3039392 RepID=UPI0024AC8CA8|nr:ribbon-helix-helix domain-containing protein [Paenibacillus sp. RC67]
MSNNSIKLGVPNQDGQLSMLFTRGGPREGAGRKRMGTTKKISLTLTDEVWESIEKECQNHQASRSEMIRAIIEAYYHSSKHTQE